MKHCMSALMLLMCFAVQAHAGDRPHLRTVEEIDRNMLWVGIALETSKSCPGIDARKVKGLNLLWSLKRRATDLGYTEAEIRAYVESAQEKKRIRGLGEQYVREQGFDPGTVDGLCAFGRSEIARGTMVGSFLR